MPMKPLQQEVDRWISSLDQGYFAPLPMLARLTEEVGELARVLMHHYGAKPPKPGEAKGDVGEEIADAMFVLVCLANSLQIDLDEAFAGVMEKYRRRDRDRWTMPASD